MSVLPPKEALGWPSWVRVFNVRSAPEGSIRVTLLFRCMSGGKGMRIAQMQTTNYKGELSVGKQI